MIEEAGLHSSCPLCEVSGVKARRDSGITVQLREEHQEIARNLEQLSVARSINNSLRSSQLMNLLDGHFKKEEQLLYPRLTRTLGPFVCDKLSFEHMEILSAAQSLTEKYQEKTPIARLEQLFLTHIATEENVLFWYLDVQPTIEKR